MGSNRQRDRDKRLLLYGLDTPLACYEDHAPYRSVLLRQPKEDRRDHQQDDRHRFA